MWACLSIRTTDRSELCYFLRAGDAPMRAGDEVCVRYHYLAPDDVSRACQRWNPSSFAPIN